MSGNASKAGGDRIEIRDLVELNIIPVASQDPDNVALAGNGTSALKTQVTSNGKRVNFANSQAKVGDFMNNTTRNRIARITKVSGNELTHSSITGQTSGDSLTFHKYAMPIASDAHVHYGRAYFVDARDKTKIRISGPNDPQDMTTDAGTLDSMTFKAGAQSPGGDIIMAMGTFQQYFVFAGRRFIALFSGTSPILDVTTNTSDFKPVSYFPQGVISPDAMLTIGNDIVFLTPDGMQSASLEGSNTLPTRQNLSDALKTEMIDELDEIDEAKVILRNFPRRNWVMAKVSSRIYAFNYSPNLGAQARGEGDVTPAGTRGSWHVMEGRLARMNDYFVRHDGAMVCCDSSGRVFEFDGNDTYTDGGSALGTYTWRYQTPHLGMDETNKGIGRPSRRQKKGTALMPTIHTSVRTTYQVRCSAPYSQESGEFITQVVDGSAVPVQTPKIPLTWRGERVRFDFQGTARGYDALTHYSVIYNEFGTK
jgi:hypothetical protein